MPNTEKFIGILTQEPGIFDKLMLDTAKRLIETEADRLKKRGEFSRIALGRALGIHRLRVVRLAKALEITHIFN